MKHILAIILLVAGTAFANAQQINQLEEIVDTTVAPVVMKPTIDSSLIGYNIVNYVQQSNSSGSVKINHPTQVDSLLARHTRANAEKKISGYRIRLFFDNKQTARNDSQTLEKDFKLKFPAIPVYRSYTNPFFKVVVGDYRTKSQATKALKEIVIVYPKAIIVKENISFPEI